MICGQEDFNAMAQSEDRATVNYIAKYANHQNHDGCVFLRLSDLSDDADDWIKRKHPGNKYAECWVEVQVTPDDIKEVQKIMLKLLKKSEEKGW